MARWVRVTFLVLAALLDLLRASIGLRLGILRSDPRPLILRRFLERAGGSWIKLGQILAMRSDFLPLPLIEELTKLLDQVPPFPFAAARKIVEADLGRPLGEIFAEFPSVPIAAASFGQVYRAVLHSGEVVAVKVLRPGLGTIIRSDLLQLRGLALLVDTLGLFGSIRLNNQIDQLEQILREEVDYHTEADNIRRAVETSRYVPIMKIPRVIDDLCTTRVLTMEFLSGIWMNEILAAIHGKDQGKLREFDERGLRRKLVAQRMYQIGLRQLFEIGMFHADPHAANIVILPDNVVGYVDFGIVGQMDEELADSQSRYLEAVKDGRINEAARALSESVVIPARLQNRLPEFRAHLANQVRDWIAHLNNRDAKLRQKSIARLLRDNIRLIRANGFGLMENTMRYYRALIISDVIVLELDPEFDTVRTLRRYFRNRQIRRLRKEMNYEKLASTAADYFELWLTGPRTADRLSRTLRRYEEGYGVAEAEYNAFLRGVARVSFVLLLVVLGFAAFGQPDVAMLVGFPFSLNWIWFAPALLVSWLTAATLSK